MGFVSPAMHKYIWKPAWWVIKHKFFLKKKYDMYENKIVRNYRDGKVTKDESDICSTCDLCTSIQYGLSVASKEQLKDRTGKEIADADIKAQKR